MILKRFFFQVNFQERSKQASKLETGEECVCMCVCDGNSAFQTDTSKLLALQVLQNVSLVFTSPRLHLNTQSTNQIRGMLCIQLEICFHNPVHNGAKFSMSLYLDIYKFIHTHFLTLLSTPTPWLTQLLVLEKSCVYQKSC